MIAERRVSPPAPAPAPGARPERRVYGKKAVLLLIVAACFVLGLAVIAQYSYIVTLHQRLSRSEERLALLAEEYREMELEAARLGSLSRIEAVARTELGMREPDRGQLKVLTAGQENAVRMRE